MSDEKKNIEDSKEDGVEEIKSRREALRKILISGGVITSASFLPDKWVKPVVDSIVVPAHALTSTFAPTAGPTASPTVSPTVAPTFVAPTFIAPSF